MIRMTPVQYEEWKAKVDAQARSILDFLASMPGGVTSCEKHVLRKIMLDTSGVMMACGRNWDIVAKSLGAGVYQLRLKERKT